jgi:hypothetical protein
LTVAGDVLVGRGATFVLGCNKTESNCFDDPASSNPSIKATLSSSGLVTGNVISTGALGTLIHQSKVGGDIRQTGGGGGKSCAPPTSGAFAQVKSPVFSDYEDTKVGGSVIVSKVTSCYLGIARLRVSGEMSLTNNKFGDPDAIEVLSNRIKGNLVCKGNSAPPGPGVWDSSETSEAPGAIFPRKLERNQVGGKRIGQCRKAGPLTQGGPPAGGPF